MVNGSLPAAVADTPRVKLVMEWQIAGNSLRIDP
jgi:hypothetical protein